MKLNNCLIFGSQAPTESVIQWSSISGGFKPPLIVIANGNRRIANWIDPHLVCYVHPSGPGGDSCLDFREDPNAEPVELWEPEGAKYINDELVIERTYYNNEEIRQPQQRWTREEQLELLNTHPMFTGFCPQCGFAFQRDYTAIVSWDCPECGWKDNSV